MQLISFEGGQLGMWEKNKSGKSHGENLVQMRSILSLKK